GHHGTASPARAGTGPRRRRCRRGARATPNGGLTGRRDRAAAPRRPRLGRPLLPRCRRLRALRARPRGGAAAAARRRRDRGGRGGAPLGGGLALQALTAGGGVRPGHRVLVNGAGGCVGPFAIQLAKHLGSHVTAVDDAARAPLVRAAGADVVVDHERVDVTRAGERYDVIVDIAATRAFPAFCRILAPRGRYTLVARDVGGFVAAGLLGRVVGGRRRMGSPTGAATSRCSVRSSPPVGCARSWTARS